MATLTRSRKDLVRQCMRVQSLRCWRCQCPAGPAEPVLAPERVPGETASFRWSLHPSLGSIPVKLLRQEGGTLKTPKVEPKELKVRASAAVDRAEHGHMSSKKSIKT